MRGAKMLIYILIAAAVAAIAAAGVINNIGLRSEIQLNKDKTKMLEARLLEMSKAMQALTDVADRLTKIIEAGDMDAIRNTAKALEVDIDRLTKNDQLLVSKINQLNSQLESVPNEINRRMAFMNKTIKVELAPQKTVGIERIVQKEGKKFKQIVMKSKPIETSGKKIKNGIPYIREAKESFAEAGL